MLNNFVISVKYLGRNICVLTKEGEKKTPLVRGEWSA